MTSRQAYYSLDNTGMPYPGLPIDIKMYFYQSVCLPTLLFGMEIMFLSDKLIKKLESSQASLMKRLLGLSKFSHHSKLLEALNISKVFDSINNMAISLWRIIFNVDSPVRDLCICYLFQICVTWKMYPRYTDG